MTVASTHAGRADACNKVTIAQALGAFVIQTPDAAIPPMALDYAAMLVASTIASAALGSNLASAQIVRDIEVARGGSAESTVWFGPGTMLPMSAAARVNTMMSDAAASDDSDLRTIVHPGAPLTAASLAAAQREGTSGRDVVAAMVLGYEVAGRFSTAMHHGFKKRGFHGCIVATLGATAAAARILGLDATQTAHALALAATSIGGLSAAANTSVAREYHGGQAALVAINAVQAAARGYTCELEVFEAPLGYLAAFNGGASGEALVQEAGANWSILTDMGIKLMPGGHPFHAIADASARAATSGNIAPSDIDAIVISRPGFQGYDLVSNPTDLVGIAHSPAYFAAAGAADRTFTWEHAFEAKINDPVIRSLLPKVSLAPPPTENLERFKGGAIVTIRTKKGSATTETVFAPRGAAIDGLHWSDLEAKYRALVPFAQVTADNLERSFVAIKGLRSAPSVAELIGLLR